MTNKSISQLTAGAAVSSTDVFPDVQTVGVGPVRVTAAQIGDYVLSGSGLTGVLPVSRGGTGLTSLGTGVATALGNAVNGASGLCVQDASGNLGVGSTTPAGTRLYINGGSLFTGSPGSYGVGISGSLTSGRIGTYDTNKATVINSYFDDSAIEISAGITSGYACGISITARSATNYANTVRFVTTGTEAARFDGSGNLLVGQSSTSSPGISNTTTGIALSGTYIAASRNDDYSYFANRNTSDGGLFWFGRQGSFIGSISITTTAVAYNQTSDISLKENIAEAPSALQSILSMPVRQFDWKSNGSHTDFGVVAQEVNEYAPEIVTQSDLWCVDYGRITPRLIKAFQELAAEVAALKGQLNG